MRLGMFDPPEGQPYATGITPSDVNTQSSQASVQASPPMHAWAGDSCLRCQFAAFLFMCAGFGTGSCQGECSPIEERW